MCGCLCEQCEKAVDNMTQSEIDADFEAHKKMKPKGFCSHCLWWFAILKDGTLRSHGYHSTDNKWCPGSHQKPSTE